MYKKVIDDGLFLFCLLQIKHDWTGAPGGDGGSGVGAGVGADELESVVPFLESKGGATVEVLSGCRNSGTVDSCPHVRHIFGQLSRTTENTGLKHSE